MLSYAIGSWSHHLTEIADGAAGRESVGGGDDCIRIDTEMAIEIIYRSGLAEMFDPKGNRLVARDCPQPGQRGRMPIGDGDQRAVGRQAGHQALDLAGRAGSASAARPLRGGTASIEPIGRSDRENADISAVLAYPPRSLDCLNPEDSRKSYRRPLFYVMIQLLRLDRTQGNDGDGL